MIYDSVDDDNLNRSLWILKNITKIRFFIKFFLMASITIIYLILAYNIFIIYQSSSQYEKLYNGFLVDAKNNNNLYNEYLKSIAPVSLTVGIQGSSKGYSGVYYDFYALVDNPNEKYELTSFDYYFAYNGETKTGIKTDKISQNSQKYILNRGIINAEGDVSDVKIVVNNLKWELVNLHPSRPTHFIDTKVPYDCKIQSNNLVASDERIDRLMDGSRGVNVFSFKVTNNSLNNYNFINNKVLFFDKSGNIIYVFEKEMNKIRSKNSVSATINLPDRLQDFGSVLVVSEVDMCNEDSYMPRDIVNTGI